MSEPARGTDLQNESLELLQHAGASAFPGVRCTRFEFSSRGDRIPSRLLSPAAGATAPLALLLPGEVRRPASEFAAPIAGWLAAGAAVASIDLPLHGERASAKLTERFCQGLGEPDRDDRVWQLLFGEFMRQAVADLGRLLGALRELGAIADAPIVCVGTGTGAVPTAAFCAVDTRLGAAALAPGAALGAAESAACASLGRFAPRPVLIVSAGGSADAIFEAAGRGAESIEANAPGPDAALEAMTPFVLAQLGLAGKSGG